MSAEAWAAWIAAAGLAHAGVQTWRSRVAANRRAGLEILRSVDRALSKLVDVPVQKAQVVILERYHGKRTTFGASAKAYLAFLNTLDLAAVAVHQRIADKKMVSNHLRTLLRGEIVSITFIQELCDACDDGETYSDLNRFLLDNPFRGSPPDHLKDNRTTTQAPATATAAPTGATAEASGTPAGTEGSPSPGVPGTAERSAVTGEEVG